MPRSASTLDRANIIDRTAHPSNRHSFPGKSTCTTHLVILELSRAVPRHQADKEQSWRRNLFRQRRRTFQPAASVPSHLARRHRSRYCYSQATGAESKIYTWTHRHRPVRHTNRQEENVRAWSCSPPSAPVSCAALTNNTCSRLELQRATNVCRRVIVDLQHDSLYLTTLCPWSASAASIDGRHHLTWTR